MSTEHWKTAKARLNKNNELKNTDIIFAGEGVIQYGTRRLIGTGVENDDMSPWNGPNQI
jgi:hypothetical protein